MLLAAFLFFQSISFAGSSCACDAPTELHRLMDSMQGVHLNLDTSKVSYQDGPNCFNAVLSAKGYVSERTKTDESEFSFFLEKFCQKKTSAESQGDILALHQDKEFYHAALSLGDGKIFEKLSTWGVTPPKVLPTLNAQEVIEKRKISSRYFIKRKEESEYFNGKSKEVGTLTIYSCKDSKDVQTELESLNLIPGIKEIQSLNKELEKVIFQKNPPQNWKEKAASRISKTLASVKVENVSKNEAKFLAVKLKSLHSQMWDFDMGLESDPFASAKTKIKNMIEQLEKRIQSR